MTDYFRKFLWEYISRSLQSAPVPLLSRTVLCYCILALSFLPLSAEIIQLSFEFSPNQIINPGFEEIDAAKELPAHWYFDNCASSPDIRGTYQEQGGALEAKCGVIETAGNLPGYLAQGGLKVEEGKTYYSSVKFRTNGPKCLLWIQTPQYSDGKSALHHPMSSTVIFSRAYPEHGSKMKSLLKNFVDPAYLVGVNAESWTAYSAEFTVPEGVGITDYTVRTGAYFGDPGNVWIDDVYFGRTEFSVNVSLQEKNLKRLRVLNMHGKLLHQADLDAEQAQQKFTFQLPSRYQVYTIEVSTVDGQIIQKEISDEIK